MKFSSTLLFEDELTCKSIIKMIQFDSKCIYTFFFQVSLLNISKMLRKKNTASKYLKTAFYVHRMYSYHMGLLTLFLSNRRVVSGGVCRRSTQWWWIYGSNGEEFGPHSHCRHDPQSQAQHIKDQHFLSNQNISLHVDYISQSELAQNSNNGLLLPRC